MLSMGSPWPIARIAQVANGNDLTLFESKAGAPVRDGWAIFSHDRTHRFALGRSWGAQMSEPVTAIVCGLNPSYADENRNDLTVTKAMRFSSKHFNATRLLMLNMYALVSTDPKGILALQPDDESTFLPHVVRELIGLMRGKTVSIAAWGLHPIGTAKREHLMMQVMPRPIMCFGETKNGRPRHLSRQGYDVKPNVWAG